MFQKATKHESKLRLAIAGPSGGGKTFTALTLATHLAPGGRIALLDTERGSASKYAPLPGEKADPSKGTFDFDACDLDPPYHPDRFVEAIQFAAKSGYQVLIVDSLSHAWNGPGGLLELVDEFAKRMKTSNSFAGWKDATPIQARLIDAFMAADLHVISTMRSKMEYVLETNEKGKSVPRKVGMAPIQRDGVEYEFDIFLEMDIDNNAIVQKSRCSAISGKVIPRPGKPLADALHEWLRGAPATARDAHQAQQQPAAGASPAAAAPAPATPALTPAQEKAQKLALGLLEQATGLRQFFRDSNGRTAADVIAACKRHGVRLSEAGAAEKLLAALETEAETQAQADQDAAAHELEMQGEAEQAARAAEAEDSLANA